MSWRPTVDPERFRPHPTSPPHRPAHTPQPGGVRGADPGWAADGGRGVGDHAQGQQAATVRAEFFWGAAGEGSVTGPANAQGKAAREPAARPRDPRSRLAAGPSGGGRGAQPEPPRGSRRETRKPSRPTPLPELLTGPPAPNLPGPTAVEPGRRPSPPPSTRPTYRRRRPTAATPSRKKARRGPKASGAGREGELGGGSPVAHRGTSLGTGVRDPAPRGGRGRVRTPGPVRSAAGGPGSRRRSPGAARDPGPEPGEERGGGGKPPLGSPRAADGNRDPGAGVPARPGRRMGGRAGGGEGPPAEVRSGPRPVPGPRPRMVLQGGGTGPRTDRRRASAGEGGG